MLSVKPKGEKSVDLKRPFSSQKLQQSYDSIGGIVRFNFKPLCRKGFRVTPQNSCWGGTVDGHEGAAEKEPRGLKAKTKQNPSKVFKIKKDP